MSNYLPLIGVIVGAVFALAGQAIFKYVDDKKSNKLLLIQCRNRVAYNICLLDHLLQRIAYLKVDSELQYFYSKFDDRDEERKKALQEHYDDYKYLSEAETRLCSCMAEIISHVYQYYDVRSHEMPFELSKLIRRAQENFIDLPNAEEFADREQTSTTEIDQRINMLFVRHRDAIVPLFEEIQDIYLV
jgi:hypothetical protein